MPVALPHLDHMGSHVVGLAQGRNPRHTVGHPGHRGLEGADSQHTLDPQGVDTQSDLGMD